MEHTAEQNLREVERGAAMDLPTSKTLDADQKANKESDYYRRNLLPVDRGWAWVICFSGFLISFTFGLENHTMAILFLEVIELFDTTLTTASLIFLSYVLGAGIMSAVATNIFVPRIGEKLVICISGFLLSVASVGFYISPNIEVFLCFSAVKGLCMGAVFVPSISLLRHYFHRRRSIAQILGRAGASTAGIFMPPLIRAVRHEYGIRGTFLVVAAVHLHVILGGLLMRPVESYKFKPDLPPLPNQAKKIKKKKRDEVTTEESCENGTEMIETKEHPGTESKSSINSHQHQTYTDVGDGLAGVNVGRKMSFSDADEDNHQISLLQNAKGEPNLSENNSTGQKEFKILREDREKQTGIDAGLRGHVKATHGLKRLGDTEHKTNGVYVTKGEERVTLLRLPEVSSNGTKDNQCGVKNIRGHGAHAWTSTMSLTSVGVPEESVVAPDVVDDNEDSDEKPAPGCGKYYFFRLWAFRMVLVFGGIGAGNIYIKNYVPTIAVSQGASLDQAAILVTLIGVVDLISRLSLGFFADTHLLKPSQIVAASHVVLGLLCQMSRLFTTFPTLVVMASVIGIFIGTRISMMPLICIEVVGVEMMPQAFSIVNTIGTFSAAIMNPSLGAVADKFGNFFVTLHILGVCFLLSASTLLMLPITHRVDKRRGHKPS